MKIATWNVNSIRVRIDLVKKFLLENDPDIICLQETKSEDDKFPQKPFYDLGWKYIVIKGQKSYNGVSIFSKFPINKTKCFDLLNKNDCRHIHANVLGLDIHNFYVPAGGDIPDRKLNIKFGDKLDFLEKIENWSTESKLNKSILLGDLNIAPLEHDVWSTKQLKNVVSHTDVERKKLLKILRKGKWVDAIRETHKKDEVLYSWWSYRAKDWKKSNRGRRLDHIWVSEDLEKKLKNSKIFPKFRGFDRPSDHVPIMIEIEG